MHDDDLESLWIAAGPPPSPSDRGGHRGACGARRTGPGCLGVIAVVTMLCGFGAGGLVASVVIAAACWSALARTGAGRL